MISRGQLHYFRCRSVRVLVERAITPAVCVCSSHAELLIRLYLVQQLSAVLGRTHIESRKSISTQEHHGANKQETTSLLSSLSVRVHLSVSLSLCISRAQNKLLASFNSRLGAVHRTYIQQAHREATDRKSTICAITSSCRSASIE